jgi:hypothetical protein
MSKKDLEYYFTPKSFIDDPYYFIGKARRIHKQRKKFEQAQKRIHEKITRLRMENQEDTTYIENLVDLRATRFEDAFRKQISPDDWAAKKSLKIERGFILLGKIVTGMVHLIRSIK